MSIYIIILASILSYGLTTLCRKWKDIDVLILVAIGCAINTNIFNGTNVPVIIGGLTFGVDSVLYTLFMFTVMIMARDYSIKQAKNMTITTIAAIMISAFIQFFADWSHSGMSYDIIVNLCAFGLSSLGTYLAVWFMLWLYKKMENKKVNVYLNFAICILLGSFINSFIYFCGHSLLTGKIATNFISIFLGSYIGKTYSVILGLICYYINQKWWIPKGLEKNNNDNNNTTIEDNLEKLDDNKKIKQTN